MYIEINSVEDLLQNIDLENTEAIYRGQANMEWGIVPSIARFQQDEGNGFVWHSWKALEDDMLQMFQKKSLPFLSPNTIPSNRFEWMILAQHHGMPTRLLDWTTNPLKALFFAVENVNSKDDGLLVQGIYYGWWNQITKIFEDIDERKHLMVYFPDDSNSRVSSQEGCFTVFPLPDEMEDFPDFKDRNAYKNDFEDITYLVIPSHAKCKIRAQLRKLGISHHTIYPGLDGLCTEIRRSFKFSW
ncbi:FRG domain-containing protein [Vibrio cholerae]|uniref:FRG domain-containing protein n=1 Tax=Vibrio cholerae TaxID=666 RepID=UPI0011D90F95|nr:FRG domain-containing protein [Vibrio cholerae]TXY49136.1 FRG domain-containing protein [Vibrio cholerae]GHW58477.1 FRG domain-containing protein [Vibrio cholerae]